MASLSALRLRRRLMVALAVYLAAYAVVGALTAILFVYPAHDPPGQADAIIVPNGEGGRWEEAMALAGAREAPVLAISTADPTRPCAPTVAGVQVICFRPDPYTTRGEARYIAAMARQRGWRKVLVVVSNTQATRARLRIRRCYHGGLRIVTVRVGRHRLVQATAYEWGALLKALVLQPSC